MEEEIKKGKIQIAASKEERAILENDLHSLAQHKEKQPRHKEKPGKIYEFDPNAIEIDYSVVKKFGALGVPPPASKDAIEKTETELRELRDTLTIAGRVQQAEGRAKFLHDDSYVQSEEYKGQKEKLDGISKQLLATIARIRKDKELRHHEDDDGVEIDKYLNSDSAENGLTKLRPLPGHRGRGGLGGRGGRTRDDYDGRNYRDREFEGEGRGRRGGQSGAQTARPGKREKLTDNAESFPELY